MKQSKTTKERKQILLTNDAFIRLGVLQSKIMRFMKRTQQVGREINKIKTWELKMSKIVLFVHRIHTFATKIGCNELLSQCLHNFLALIGPFHPPSRVALTHLLIQCQKYHEESKAVIIIGGKLSDFQFAGVNCCIQFCKLVQNYSDFQLTLRRCSQFVEGYIENHIVKNIQGQGKFKMHKSSQFANYLSQNINTYLINANQLKAFQYLIAIYKIGAIKSCEQCQKNQYRNKLSSFQNFLAEKGFDKQLARNGEQMKGSQIKLIKQKKNQKKLISNIDSPKRIIHIPPIDFKNRLIIKQHNSDISQAPNCQNLKILQEQQNAVLQQSENNKPLVLISKSNNLGIYNNIEQINKCNTSQVPSKMLIMNSRSSTRNLYTENKQNLKFPEQKYQVVQKDIISLQQLQYNQKQVNNNFSSPANNEDQKIQSQIECMIQKNEEATQETQQIRETEEKERQIRMPSINEQCVFKATWSCEVVGTNGKCLSNQREKNQSIHPTNFELSAQTSNESSKKEINAVSISSLVSQIQVIKNYTLIPSNKQQSNKYSINQLLQVIQQKHESPSKQSVNHSIKANNINLIQSNYCPIDQTQIMKQSQLNATDRLKKQQKISQKSDKNLLPLYYIQIFGKQSNTYQIQYYLKHIGCNQQVVGHIKSISKVQSKEIILPLSILQSYSAVSQSIKQQNNYLILESDNKGSHKIVLLNIWHRALEAKIKLSLQMRKTVIIHAVLYQIFCEDNTFDALITLQLFHGSCNSHQVVKSNLQLNQNSESCRKRNLDNSFIGKIWISRLNYEYWEKLQNLLQEVVGCCIKSDGTCQLTVNQNPTAQDILTLLQLIQ